MLLQAFDMPSAWSRVTLAGHLPAAASGRLRLSPIVLCCIVLVVLVTLQQAAYRRHAPPPHRHSGGLPSLDGLDSGEFYPPAPPAALGTDLSPPAGWEVEWSRFAYYQSVVSVTELCSALQLFARLRDLGCRADRVLSHPSSWSQFGKSEESRLLLQAKEAYDVRLQPTAAPSTAPHHPVWGGTFRKLLALNQTSYDRVLGVDQHSIILQCLDHLFLLPPSPVIMSAPYLGDPWPRGPADQLVLVERSSHKLDLVLEEIRSTEDDPDDLSETERLYVPHAMLLPQREYGLSTTQFRASTRAKKQYTFTGSITKRRRPEDMLHQAKLLHISDHLIPKPWLPISADDIRNHGPECTLTDCEEHNLWYTIYGDYKRRRMEICGSEDWGGEIKPATLL